MHDVSTYRVLDFVHRVKPTVRIRQKAYFGWGMELLNHLNEHAPEQIGATPISPS